MTISSAVWIQCTNVTDGLTDTGRQQRPRLRISSRSKNIMPPTFATANKASTTTTALAIAAVHEARTYIGSQPCLRYSFVRSAAVLSYVNGIKPVLTELRWLFVRRRMCNDGSSRKTAVAMLPKTYGPLVSTHHLRGLSVTHRQSLHLPAKTAH